MFEFFDVTSLILPLFIPAVVIILFLLLLFSKDRVKWMITIVDFFSLTLEPFFRKDFGERYFTLPKFLFSTLLLIVFLSPGISLFVRATDIFSLILGACVVGVLIAYLVIAGTESTKNFIRNRDNIRWHTYHAGTSRFGMLQIIQDKLGISKFLGYHLINPFVLQIFIEPAVAIVISILILVIIAILATFLPYAILLTTSLSGWLFVSAIFMHIKSLILYSQVKNQVLDVRDNQITSKFFPKLVNSEIWTKNMIPDSHNPEKTGGYFNELDPSQTEGFTVRGIRPESSKGFSTQEAILNALKKNPELEEKFLKKSAKQGKDGKSKKT